MPDSNEGRGPEADNKADPSGPPANPTSSSEVVQAPNAEALDGIVSEGEGERLALSHRAAHAVFRDPASVTPRLMALLGEVGLAEFVQQIRDDAEWLILREREKRQAGGSVEAENGLGKTTAPPPVKRPPRYRRPANFGKPTPPAKPSLVERGVGCVLPVLRTLFTDVAIYSVIAGISLAVLIVGARLFAFSLN